MISRVASGIRARTGPTVAVALVAIAVTFLAAAGALAGQDSWSMSGQGITNWRFQPGETELNPGNVSSLAPAWVATLAGDISATPAVVDGEVYVPDWGGKIWKLDAKTGAVIWSKSVATITGIPDTGFPRPISRTSPAVVNDVVVFGSQAGAWLIALKRNSGEAQVEGPARHASHGRGHAVTHGAQGGRVRRRGLPGGVRSSPRTRSIHAARSAAACWP